MTYVPVKNMDYPASIQVGSGSFNLATTTIDATGEMYVWTGAVRWADRSVTTRDIRSARFLFSNTGFQKGGGSGLKLSVQAFDTANGPPGRPDGTPLGSVLIPNAQADFASNSYCQTGNLDVDVPVDYGERICVVLEFDANGRLGADTIPISHVAGNVIDDGIAIFTNGSWSSPAANNGLVLVFADGALGYLDPTIPLSVNTVSFGINTGTNPDEIALKFTPDFKCMVDGMWAGVLFATGADYEMVLYEGTTPLRMVAIDYNTMRTGSFHCVVLEFEELELTPGTAYYIAVRPTTANSVTLRGYTAFDAETREMMSGMDTSQWAQRVDAGAWDDSLTLRRPMIGVRLSAIDNGAGGGGGGGGDAVIIRRR